MPQSRTGRGPDLSAISPHFLRGTGTVRVLFRRSAWPHPAGMADQAHVLGNIVQYDEPVWEPLERAVGEELAGTFMWMYEIETAGHGYFQAYKHIETRCYIHLDDDARAYEYIPEQRYRPIPLADAIALALASWHRLGASPRQLALVDAAIERARA
jgi:hypothetical protein